MTVSSSTPSAAPRRARGGCDVPGRCEADRARDDREDDVARGQVVGPGERQADRHPDDGEREGAGDESPASLVRSRTRREEREPDGDERGREDAPGDLRAGKL